MLSPPVKVPSPMAEISVFPNLLFNALSPPVTVPSPMAEISVFPNLSFKSFIASFPSTGLVISVASS